MLRTWLMVLSLGGVISSCDKGRHEDGKTHIMHSDDDSSDQQESEIPAKVGASPGQENDAEARGGLSLASHAMRTRLAEGIDFSTLDDNGSTLLHWAAARQKNTAMLKFLLAQGVIDINKQNEAGYTALHLAARTGDYGGVELLLQQRGIDKSLRNRYNQTAHDTAVAKKRTHIAALLAAE